jgi:MFS family permease
MLPSTFMTMRYGARGWYSAITVAWGIVSDHTGLASSWMASLEFSALPMLDSSRDAGYKSQASKRLQGAISCSSLRITMHQTALTSGTASLGRAAALASMAASNSHTLLNGRDSHLHHCCAPPRCHCQVATCNAFISSAGQLYALRLLLGVFEAGSATSAWHLLAQFYPQDRCAVLAVIESGPTFKSHGTACFCML